MPQWGPREDRFRDRMVVSDDGHWLWTGRIDPNGYGRLGKDWAHRVAYELFVGPIAPGLTIDHLCRVRPCVNPAHLEMVTLAENIRRGPGNGNGRKTHCPQGHEYTPENTQWKRTGKHGTPGRWCRACIRAYRERTRAHKREYDQRRREQKRASLG